MSLSENGEIRVLGMGPVPADDAITFTFHKELDSCRREFTVEPYTERKARNRDFYFGHNEFYTEAEPKPFHRFDIKLPKV